MPPAGDKGVVWPCGATDWGDNLMVCNISAQRFPQSALIGRFVRETISCEPPCQIGAMGPRNQAPRVVLQMTRGGAGKRRRTHASRKRGTFFWAPEGPSDRVVRSACAPSAGHAIIAGARPLMVEWLERQHGTFAFRLTQIMTGHVSFFWILCHIVCRDNVEDTVLHTLVECSD